MADDRDFKKSLDIDAIGSSCVLVKLEAEDLPADTQISYQDGKIILRDSIGNSVKFETNELTILHSGTVVVNSSAYIITAPNVKCLAGVRYYVADSGLCRETLEADDVEDDVSNDNDVNSVNEDNSDTESSCDSDSD